MQTDARTSMKPMKLNGGFTLVELIMVMVITGILGASMLIFFKPAVDSYFDSRRRAGLTDMADTALRKMGRDIRSAVPNSIRISPDSKCFELIPTITGGRYRMDVDTSNASTIADSEVLNTSTTTTKFDVLTPLSPIPSAGDWVIVANQDADQVYSGSNRAAIASVDAPSQPGLGQHTITLSTATQFPSGYDGGRFVVAKNSEKAVFYVCSNPGISAGTGTGTLYRLSGYGFNASAPSSCPATTGAAIVAEHVSACTFVYSPNQGATQESGFVWMQLEMTDTGETIALNYGAHVDNVP